MVINHYYMRSFFICLGLLFMVELSSAQKSLLFFNTQANKTIQVKVGHRASILYKGYLGQLEFAKETVTDITDSTIVLGINLAETMPRLAPKPGKSTRLTYKVIRINDIVGFRRMTLGRQFVRLTLTAAGLVGTFVVFNQAKIQGFTSFNASLITFGAGLGFLWINNLILPENIKYYMESGWQVKVLND